MPSGKTHDKITRRSTPLIVVISSIFFIYISNSLLNAVLGVLIISLSYSFAAYMFSGDLDLPSKQYRRWGILRWIWIPYQKIFNHRSIFTHGIILGPIFRLLYLYIIALPFWIFFLIKKETSLYIIIEKTISFIMNPSIYFIYFFIGIMLGGLSHSLADLFIKEPKRKKRNKIKRNKK